jgi:hypothetical protein
MLPRSNLNVRVRVCRIAGLLVCSFVFAQTPMQVQPIDVLSHQSGREVRIRSSKFGSLDQDFVTVKVVVNQQGKVASVQALNGPKEFFNEAEKLEARKIFTPFERNGVPTRATFEETVSIVPPEQRPSVRVPFPEVKDWHSLRMSIERRNCRGPCFLYSAEVHGDGEVDFNGGPGMPAPGQHRSRISKQAVQDPLAAFRRADFFSLKDSYEYPQTDSEGIKTSIQFDGQKKLVDDYVGILMGIPEAVKQLEDSFDQLAGTGKWVKGDSRTEPPPRAEAKD